MSSNLDITDIVNAVSNNIFKLITIAEKYPIATVVVIFFLFIFYLASKSHHQKINGFLIFISLLIMSALIYSSFIDNKKNPTTVKQATDLTENNKQNLVVTPDNITKKNKEESIIVKTTLQSYYEGINKKDLDSSWSMLHIDFQSKIKGRTPEEKRAAYNNWWGEEVKRVVINHILPLKIFKKDAIMEASLVYILSDSENCMYDNNKINLKKIKEDWLIYNKVMPDLKKVPCPANQKQFN